MSDLSNGDSGTPLTVHQAAEVLESLDGLLSEKEDPQPEAATPEKASEEKESPEPEASETDAEVEEPAEEEEEVKSEEPEEEAEPTPEAPAKHKVVVDGQEHEVTLDEALKGYSRQQDYTRKTQQHAETVRAYEAQKATETAAAQAERQYYRDNIAQIEQTLKSLTQEPDWDKLRSEDPNLFAQTHAAWEVHTKRLDAITAERQRVEAELAKDAHAGFQRHLQAEGEKLLEAIPEWKDTAKSKEGKAELKKYAESIGFSPEELNQVADHRALVMLHKAMLYDRAQAAQAEAAKKAQAKIDRVKVVAPGPSDKTKPKVTDLTRAKMRLSKTGSVHDAARALELMDG